MKTYKFIFQDNEDNDIYEKSYELFDDADAKKHAKKLLGNANDNTYAISIYFNYDLICTVSDK